MSPKIKSFCKELGVPVRVRSVFAGRISNAITVDPANSGDWNKVVPALKRFAKANAPDAIVYQSDYNDRIMFEYPAKPR